MLQYWPLQKAFRTVASPFILCFLAQCFNGPGKIPYAHSLLVTWVIAAHPFCHVNVCLLSRGGGPPCVSASSTLVRTSVSMSVSFSSRSRITCQSERSTSAAAQAQNTSNINLPQITMSPAFSCHVSGKVPSIGKHTSTSSSERPAYTWPMPEKRGLPNDLDLSPPDTSVCTAQ